MKNGRCIARLSCFIVLNYILVFPNIVAAEEIKSDWGYITIGGGSSILNSSKVSILNQNMDGYLKGKMGNSAAFKAAIGTQIEQLRAEIEFLHINKHKFKLDEKIKHFENVGLVNKHKSSFSSNALFLNVYYQFGQNEVVRPYIGGGIGMAKNKAHQHIVYGNQGQKLRSSPHRNKNSFAWNVGVGSLFKITDNFYLDASYRFADLGKVQSSSTICTDTGCGAGTLPASKARMRDHLFMVGVGFRF